MFDFSTPITANLYLKGQWNCPPPIDPNNPTLSSLKLALQEPDPASIYPLGTEIPDQIYMTSSETWRSSPWVVALYLTGEQSVNYDGQEGVILMRKYVDYSHEFYTDGSASDALKAQYYVESDLRQWLLTTYYEQYCAEGLKSVISPFTYTGKSRNGRLTRNDMFFLMGSAEVYAFEHSNIEYNGYNWEYWKTRVKRTSPSYLANNDRIFYTQNDEPQTIWLRDRAEVSGTSQCNTVKGTGMVIAAKTSSTCGIVPCCFISK